MTQDPLQTPEGEALWRTVSTCANQVLAIEAGAYAWNYPAVLQVAALLGAPADALAELLQPLEQMVLFAHTPEDRP